MIYEGTVISRYQPPPTRAPAFNERVGIAERPARVRVRFGNWEETRTVTFDEPAADRLAVGTRVSVNGPDDLGRGGSCSLVDVLR